jgi:hypothetical protein
MLKGLFSLNHEDMYCKAKEGLGSPNDLQTAECTAKVMYQILSVYLHDAK